MSTKISSVNKKSMKTITGPKVSSTKSQPSVSGITKQKIVANKIHLTKVNPDGTKTTTKKKINAPCYTGDIVADHLIDLKRALENSNRMTPIIQKKLEELEKLIIK